MTFIKQIPNLFTLGNLYCGFLSISYAGSSQYKNAAILILIGMMLDSMDGRLARMLHVESPLGKELDSLADIVTFGVAPSLLIYYTLFLNSGWIGLAICGLFPLFGAYRLARFNICSKEDSMEHFIGVPITAAGGILAILTLFSGFIPSIVTIVIFTALCYLMVSSIKIPSFKKVPLPRYGTIVTIFLGALLTIINLESYKKFPTFLYVATPLYLIYVTYRFIKIRESR
ncbi:CDP-diacylglycerol--serine O-phosphatidyltransferase [Virgibacillus pantothenticus]|uniref:CDP-diacylglycerol--serine O-phosphatidyltransferase n=1 Tax=Virgibacillus pantothenticus TaxID=1473 RepID=A0A0L0QRQ9_VIRPA|nr:MULTISPECIES: CDP-diacylglycerol--serine O-phosphatidyltransferase [Virgibacillus]API92163.1 CDP-diacylglycerol--serine O-phosphatidyltransferase [Virgibacillus sp. 6R]KNE21226.1 CDP-diacylglycerol--serine O-phosphatidyltransferase [Virgibacillus pantothenticus]MBS7427243.1 CDP-diacylglycerol--serine O-phosphatidyltransferase [Virgibacillus sp. 19R1-5]MBU8568654.1 CDP-diacylglycerol--serine O-phosphatidyltransferase [Virgibacillus pantothenticus]MBU8602677.1 CDP-diacylglycerol--serine O-pho